MKVSSHRLYRDDPYRTNFEAHVLQRLEVGDQPAVVLDATCFYPTSGGQPHDAGTLNGVAVTDVREQGEALVHVLAGPLVADKVRGEIDWMRRLDHMQQHTGQHVLSQAFVRELGAATLSFHLGETASTIDVELPALDWEAAALVEEAANRIVLANLPVTIREYREGESVEESLRKAPRVEGALRVVLVGDFDASACCGTHVRATGEIGPIHIRRWERRKGQTRVEFLCGWRALHSHRTLNGICQELAAHLTVSVADLPQSVLRLRETADAAHKTVQELRRRLMESEIDQMAGQAEPCGGLRVLYRLLDGYDVPTMRTLAQRLVQQPDLVVLLGVMDPAPQVCFACSQNVSLDVAELLRQALDRYGGRGGGTPQFALGGGVAAFEVAAVLAVAAQQLDCMNRR